MTRTLTPEDFNVLFGQFRHYAFRLEVQPTYKADYEQEALNDFLRGEPRPAPEYDYYAPWLASVREVTAEGRRIERVRVLQEPPTDYQRFELWMARYNIAAGELLRCMTVKQAGAAGVPTTSDWWLFDSTTLAVMRFSADGVPQGGRIITDPTTVSRYNSWRDLAVAHSTPYAECAPAAGATTHEQH
jgi:hypothetical protein